MDGGLHERDCALYFLCRGAQKTITNERNVYTVQKIIDGYIGLPKAAERSSCKVPHTNMKVKGDWEMKPIKRHWWKECG